MVNKLLDDTRQYQRESLVESRVRSALRHTHGIAFFTRDYVSVELENQEAAENTIGTIQLPNNFRAVTVVRPMSGGKFLPGIAMEKVSSIMIPQLEKEGKADDTFHTFGNVLEYRCRQAAKDFKIGYFAFPAIALPTASTWISEQYDDVVRVLAESRIRQTLGDKEAARNLMDEYRILVQDIVNENETGVTE